MKPLLMLAASCCCSCALIAEAQAQPILNRIEEFVRDQVDAVRPQTPTEPGYLGLIGDDADQGGRGVRVIEVYPDQPAARAGLRVDDVITKIDGRPIANMDAMAAALSGKAPGAKLAVVVERAGGEQPLTVTLGRRPAADDMAEDLPPPSELPPADVPRPRLGVRTVPVTEEVRRANNLPDTNGCQVISVSVNSAAEEAGIPLGVVITAVDGRPVRTPQELASVISNSPRPSVELTYVDNGRAVRKTANIGQTASDDGPQLELSGRPPQPQPVAPAPVTPPPTTPPPTTPPPVARPPVPNKDRVQELEQRIRELEARIKALETERTESEPAESGDES